MKTTISIDSAQSTALVPNSRKATEWGVTTRAVYDWVRDGILPQPVRIRGRIYWPEGTTPKFDRPDASDAKSA